MVVLYPKYIKIYFDTTNPLSSVGFQFPGFPPLPEKFRHPKIGWDRKSGRHLTLHASDVPGAQATGGQRCGTSMASNQHRGLAVNSWRERCQTWEALLLIKQSPTRSIAWRLRNSAHCRSVSFSHWHISTFNPVPCFYSKQLQWGCEKPCQANLGVGILDFYIVGFHLKGDTYMYHRYRGTEGTLCMWYGWLPLFVTWNALSAFGLRKPAMDLFLPRAALMMFLTQWHFSEVTQSQFMSWIPPALPKLKQRKLLKSYRAPIGSRILSQPTGFFKG